MQSGRCDAAIVIFVVTEYDEHGRPIGEKMSQQIKIFRASTPDLWSAADRAVKQAAVAPPAPPTPAPPSIARRKRR